MTNLSLAQSYLHKALARMKLLPVLFGEQDYSDVIREAQEIVELSLKGMLRQVGIEPPKWHDVGGLLVDHRERLAPETPETLERLAGISKWLRKERELSFYGDIDFIPDEEYDEADAERAMTDADFVVAAAQRLIEHAR